MPRNLEAVKRMLQWGNRLLQRTNAVTEGEVAEMWTPDGAMIVNGQTKCAGLAALVKHFEELRRKLKRVEAQLPLIAAVEQGDAVATRYVIDVEHLDGARDRIHVGAFFEVTDGRIHRMNEVVSFERREIELDAH